MKQKWLIDIIIAVAAVAVMAVWLLCFPPMADAPATAPEPSAPITTEPSEPAEEDDVYIPNTLSFTGKVLELDGDSVLMKCLDSDRFDTVWANVSGLDITPQVGEEYVVYHEDLVMPSLPPRITVVKMELSNIEPSASTPTQGEQWELKEDEFQSGDFIYVKVDDGIAILAHLDADAVHIDVPQKIDGLPVVQIGGGDGFCQHKVMESITLPEGLKRINDSCFYRCYNLKTVVIPSTVTEISANPFWRASSLAEIQVAHGNKAFKSVDGVLYDITEKTLISYPEGKKQESFYVPNSVKTIRDDAFGYHPLVRNLYLTKTVQLESAYLTAHQKDLHLHIFKNSFVDKMLQALEEPYHPYSYR